jgi:hypothetical protein
MIGIWSRRRVLQYKKDTAQLAGVPFGFRGIHIAPFPRSTAPLRVGHCASEVLGATKLAEVWLLNPRRTRVAATHCQHMLDFRLSEFCIPLEFLYVGQPILLRPLVGLLAKAAQDFMK